MEATLEERALAIGDRRSSRAFYKLMRALLRLLLWPWFRVRFTGRERLSVEGPLIIAPVHRSMLDVPIVGAGSSRVLKYLAKEELFSGALSTWFVSSLGGFPVRRGGADRGALRSARLLLDRGEGMLVFPEGTRQTGPEVAELFEGTAYLAAKTGARVVPVGVSGTEAAMPTGTRIPKRTRVAVVVGQPLDPPEAARSARREFTEKLRIELQATFDEAQARVS